MHAYDTNPPSLLIPSIPQDKRHSQSPAVAPARCASIPSFVSLCVAKDSSQVKNEGKFLQNEKSPFPFLSNLKLSPYHRRRMILFSLFLHAPCVSFSIAGSENARKLNNKIMEVVEGFSRMVQKFHGTNHYETGTRLERD